MDMKHYLPEQQYLGHVALSDIDKETGTAYTAIVEEFDLTSGLYSIRYYETPLDGDSEEVFVVQASTAELAELFADEAA